MKLMMYLSDGNRKMKKGFLIWNLPAIKTCIGCTGVCASKCYARKAEKMYPDCLPSRIANYEESMLPGFADELIKVIAKASKSKKFKGLFRIHESGDFYNQEYVNAWVNVIRSFPNIQFLAFTKSFTLDFSEMRRPDNVTLICSIMTDTTLEPIQGLPKAFAGDCNGIDWEKTLKCPGSCDDCGMCWQLPKTGMNVHFDMH
jgi:ferredoxin